MVAVAAATGGPRVTASDYKVKKALRNMSMGLAATDWDNSNTSQVMFSSVADAGVKYLAKPLGSTSYSAASLTTTSR